jgi:hypothetical protein
MFEVLDKVLETAMMKGEVHELLTFGKTMDTAHRTLVKA